VEIGLRCLFLLLRFRTEGLSIDKLIYLDYFLIHAGDVSKEQKSIHPKYPFRSTEIVVKRELLTNALKLLICRELINVHFSATGIIYKITNIGCKAVAYFESDYAKRIIEVSNWIYTTYHTYTERQLSDVIHANIQKWGSEFANESKFRTLFE
ncbi:MAG: ABC-three component system middle component 2, partial [Mucilaginibacter sp.]